MKRKQILILTICMTFSVGVLYSLYALSPFAAQIRRQPFERNFDYRIYLSKQSEVDLKVNSFYIAGAAKNTIYLGNFTGPFHLVQVTLPKLDTLHFNVNIPDIKIGNDYQMFRMKVDSPDFYLTHGVMPGIYVGQLETYTAKSFLSNGCPYFIDAIRLSHNRFVLKALSHETKINELATFTTDSPYFEFKPEILERQVDGIFCVDGTLDFDNSTGKVVYVYAYRNEYIVADTNLNLVNRFHTIDTFKTANVKVANINSKNYSTLASPPSRTNINTWLSENLLFIQSPFLASNENKLAFQESCPIDVYDISEGKYLYSFHLPTAYDHRPSSFTVLGNYLVAIYDHHLVLFNIELPKIGRIMNKTVSKIAP